MSECLECTCGVLMVVMCTCGGVDGGHVPVGVLMVVMCTCGGHVYLLGCWRWSCPGEGCCNCSQPFAAGQKGP